MRQRTGTIYLDRSLKYFRRAVGRVGHNCWRGEITVRGRRFRCRNNSRTQVEHWVRDMVEKYPTWIPEKERERHEKKLDRGRGCRAQGAVRCHTGRGDSRDVAAERQISV